MLKYILVPFLLSTEHDLALWNLSWRSRNKRKNKKKKKPNLYKRRVKWFTNIHSFHINYPPWKLNCNSFEVLDNHLKFISNLFSKMSIVAAFYILWQPHQWSFRLAFYKVRPISGWGQTTFLIDQNIFISYGKLVFKFPFSSSKSKHLS